VPEIVEHGSTGLLTVAGERSALTRAVFHLLDDDGERQRMGMAARERYTRRFHIREVAARYAALFEEVAS
jgi:glycosyltransferase involved in cell wall biosynthesis